MNDKCKEREETDGPEGLMRLWDRREQMEEKEIEAD